MCLSRWVIKLWLVHCCLSLQAIANAVATALADVAVSVQGGGEHSWGAAARMVLRRRSFLVR